jgi:hypothetical protein
VHSAATASTVNAAPQPGFDYGLDDNRDQQSRRET